MTKFALFETQQELIVFLRRRGCISGIKMPRKQFDFNMNILIVSSA